MNYIKITEFDTANGIGIGTVLWVSGCNHNCEGCHNPQTHDPAVGHPYTEQTYKRIVKTLEHPYISRLTLSGGDPLYPANRQAVTELCKGVKQTYPDKKIWLYTGYSWEGIKSLEVMKYIDYVVDGKFIQSLKDLNLEYRGSSNQRIIDVQKSVDTDVVNLNSISLTL